MRRGARASGLQTHSGKVISSVSDKGLQFERVAVDPETGARAGRVTTPHGSFETPVFMPVGTQGTVKALTQEMLEEAGARIILGNPYPLYPRLGHRSINRLGAFSMQFTLFTLATTDQNRNDQLTSS